MYKINVISGHNSSWNRASRMEAPITLFSSVTVSNGTKPLKVITVKELFEYQTQNDQLKKDTLYLRQLKANDIKLYKDQRVRKSQAFIVGKWLSRGQLDKQINLIIIDIDGGDESTYRFSLEFASRSPYIYRIEQSLGGGSRVYVWGAITDYLDICKHIGEVLEIPLKDKDNPNQREHIDTSTGDITRLWFPAYTPPELIYHNEESKVWPSSKPPTLAGSEIIIKKENYTWKFSDEEKLKDIIRQIIENKLDITKGVETWFTKILLPVASFYGEPGRSIAHSISQFHPEYNPKETDKEFSRALAKDKGIVSVGSFLQHAKQQGIHYDSQRIISNRQALDKTTGREGFQSELEGDKTPVEVAPIEEDQFFEFYEVVKKGDPRIKHLKLVQLLLKLGFVRYDLDGEFFIVRRKDNVVRECSKQEVIDAFDTYLDKQPEELPGNIKKEVLRNKIYAGISGFFSNDILGRLRPESPIILNEHTKDAAYFYYQNGFVEVTKEGVHLRPYSELKNCIWEDQILQRDFVQVSPQKYRYFSFYKFLKNIANCWEVHPCYGRTNPNNDPIRLESFKTIIGYLLHAFFDRELKAVIFTDSRISEDNDANGRSGKTLLLKALGHVLNREFKKSKTYVELNGKDFDTSKTFKYQELGLDTKLAHLNDVRRRFKIEDLFNDITEGIRRERKNEAPSIIRVKIALSTNLTIKISGSSARGRAVEVELSEYYDDNWSPKQEFGEWFFAEWSVDQWAMFDSLLMDCVRAYFHKGIITPATINLEERKKIEETAPEFIQWMEDREVANKSGERFDKSELHKSFTERYPDFEWLKQRKFTSWLRLFCEYDPNYKGIKESRSNGRNYVTFEIAEERG